jgi:hypothetical protein
MAYRFESCCKRLDDELGLSHEAKAWQRHFRVSYVFARLIASGGAITWVSKKQKAITIITLSSTEAEYVALSEAAS